MNIYAVSRAEKRQKRETFFTYDLAYFLPASSKEILLARDFKCVISPSGVQREGAWRNRDKKTWKNSTTQQFTTQYEPPPAAKENVTITIRRLKVKVI